MKIQVLFLKTENLLKLVTNSWYILVEKKCSHVTWSWSPQKTTGYYTRSLQAIQSVPSKPVAPIPITLENEPPKGLDGCGSAGCQVNMSKIIKSEGAYKMSKLGPPKRGASISGAEVFTVFTIFLVLHEKINGKWKMSYF